MSSEQNGISFGISIKKNKPTNIFAKTFGNENDSSDNDTKVKTKDDHKKIINEKIKRHQEANHLKVNKLLKKF